MWTTFSKQSTTTPQKNLVPGDFGAASTITISDNADGVEIIPADASNNVRFANLSLENKADSNGDPISIYIGIGFDPTPTLYSFELLSGQQEYAMQINGQQIKTICESGQTIKANIQLANAIIKNL
ncbi:hypothetical protein PCC9214_05336 [Planktothrix tepida]|uniref:Uncharacterized protein n=1 Tax=Planktothrix tepida PCC 9214 TaxID=671072 RepID=A0A1J1LI31_9CYAN|nr:hypothetical protein [Planktothrix tepida]CAD5984777.1 hypothetical protein PCC9214_05300 [Planktothrix tepida]CAD5985061.1 hypothetical protein PCC9214_05336 [Planktothrix tepida]CUR32151.1 hypothetical protein PL9214430123 [Planktothrix tepida PCC 9214]